ncbi:MAG: hypothetical protein GWP91_11005 [Rhodobacterales bacterium]|nr:hypothetical protein [Rhodobacterales bacterium]
MWWIVALMGCVGSPDPDLVQQQQAVALWEQGKIALEAGDAGLARQRFIEARTRRPEDALLMAWEAQAMAAQGDLPLAILKLDDALRLEPQLVEARYNRAAWLARMGDHLEAAQTLAPLVREGEISAVQVRDDADFNQALQGPFFAFLPGKAVTMSVDTLASRAFWGSQVDYGLTFSGGGDGPLSLALPVSGPVLPVALVEDLTVDGRRVTLTVKAQGQGGITFGPVDAKLAGQHLQGGAFSVDAIAPEDKMTPTSLPAVVALAPSALSLWMPEIGARAVNDDLWIRLSPADRVEFSGAESDRVRYELRRGGQPEVRWYRYPGLGTNVERVLVWRGTEVIWEGLPLASPPLGG